VKRWAFTILLFLLLGAIVNVAVAWGLAVWLGVGRQPYQRQEIVYPFYDDWSSGDFFYAAWRRQGACRILSFRKECDGCPYGTSEHYVIALLLNWNPRLVDWDPSLTDWVGFRPPRWSRVSRDAISVADDNRVSLIEDARGWPMLTMRSRFRIDAAGNIVVSSGFDGVQLRSVALPTTWFGGALAGDLDDKNWAEPYVLPLRPIWPGLVLNTLLYALVLWLLYRGSFVLRRHIRRKRGRCPKCGYDLRGQLPGAGCPECGWNRQQNAAG